MATIYDEQLSVEVPTHLFKFEEKIFGLTVQQLLLDTFAATGEWYLWNLAPSLPTRILLCSGLALLTIVLVHVRFKRRSLTEWGTIALFYWLTPPKAIWYNPALSAVKGEAGQKARRPSVQATWVRLDSITSGYLCFKSGSKKDSTPARYSVVLEVTGVNLDLLADEDMARIFAAYESFLAGLEFPLQIMSNNEVIDVQSYEPLLEQEKNLARLRNRPRLAAMAQSHQRFLRKNLGTCIVTRHFIVISATPLEESLRNADGKMRTGLSAFAQVFLGKNRRAIPVEQVIQQLRVRVRVVRDGFKDMGLETRVLDNRGLAQFYATCLAPGQLAPRGERLADTRSAIVTVREKRKEESRP